MARGLAEAEPGGHGRHQAASLSIQASVACSRSHAGCTMSWASAWSPSARLAIPTSRGRSAANVSVWFTAPPFTSAGHRSDARVGSSVTTRGEGAAGTAPRRRNPLVGKRHLQPPLVSRRCTLVLCLDIMTSMQGQPAANSHDDRLEGAHPTTLGERPTSTVKPHGHHQDPRTHPRTRSSARTEP